MYDDSVDVVDVMDEIDRGNENEESKSSKRLYTLATPITPQANRPPALPVVLENSWPPFPRSSASAWTTIDRPRTLLIPGPRVI